MPSKKPLLLLFALLLIPGATWAQGLKQDPKQQLNEQFWEAVRKGDLPAVTALLDKGADVNAKFRYGSTALFKAAERGHTDVVKLLLARGADASVKDTFYGFTAMNLALQNKQYDAVRAILEKDATSVDAVLMTGTEEENIALVRAAIEKGGLKAETLTSALVLTMSEKNAANLEIAEALKKAGAVPPPEIAAETLQSYVGKYRGDPPTPELAVTLKDGKLFIGPVGQQPFLLMPLDQTSFKPASFGGMNFTFNVEAGKATSISLKQGTITTQLKRIE